MVAYAGMKRATADELAHLAAVKQLPCCLCLTGMQRTRTEVHHLIRGNKRLGHFYVLPYCRAHHATAQYHKQHEKALWQKLNDQLGIVRAWPVSKILSRRDVA